MTTAENPKLKSMSLRPVDRTECSESLPTLTFHCPGSGSMTFTALIFCSDKTVFNFGGPSTGSPVGLTTPIWGFTPDTETVNSCKDSSTNTLCSSVDGPGLSTESKLTLRDCKDSRTNCSTCNRWGTELLSGRRGFKDSQFAYGHTTAEVKGTDHCHSHF